MDATRLSADFTGPTTQDKSTDLAFFWRSRSKLYPRVRYRLVFFPSGRTFALHKFIQFKLGGREMKRPIEDPDAVSLFRAALLPEHLATIARRSINRTRQHHFGVDFVEFQAPRPSSEIVIPKISRALL